MASSSQKILDLIGAECVAVRSHPFGEQAEVAVGNPILTIEGRDYSPDDPTAVEGMTDRGRALFWKNCSDKGRDSTHYLAFAAVMLALETGLFEEDVEDAEKYAILIKRAHRFCELAGGLDKAGCRDWKETVLSASNEKLPLLLDAPKQTGALVKALRGQSTPDPLQLLVALDAAALKSVLENADTHVAEAARGVKLSEKWCQQPEAEPTEVSSPGLSCR